ncbi:MAG TPA: thermonuclease family protein [Dongiaceae bacterium]|nr:thermonuclease family protein [Dongiaceae bacterium]
MSAALLSTSALAQATQPAPDPVPVGEVDATVPAPLTVTGQTIEGTATIIDGDELRIGDQLVRLFGIAAPDISSNLGPDARVYLDGLAGGQRVVCIETDRPAPNSSVAICTIDGTDLATELLAQGLASVYRISASPTPQERELAARYDTEEADARTRQIGLWAPRGTAVALPPPPPSMIETLLPRWAAQIPLLALIGLLGVAGLILYARRTSEPEGGDANLTAVLLAEVTAIRDSAHDQYQGTATLIQDLPIPSSQQGLLGLPRAAVYVANADKLDLLDPELAQRLVRFYALADGVAQLLPQAGNVRCETIRAALGNLAETATDVLMGKPS